MKVSKKGGSVILMLLAGLIFSACDSDEDVKFIPPSNLKEKACEVQENGWTIPTQTVADGGVGKDGIPSIDNPQFVSIHETRNLLDEELVIVAKIGTSVRVYPQRILDQHEVVNDLVDDIAVAVTFCPLTGTALAYDRRVNGEVTTLGVSGLLYNSNLVLYDRSTDTKWAQMTSEAINGELACDKLNFLPVLEMTWAGVKSLFPKAQVLSGDTGFDRNYRNIPFSSQVPLNSLPSFPYFPKDTRLANYERVLAIIDSLKVSAFSLEQFDQELAITVENSNLIISDPTIKLVVSYKTGSGVFSIAEDVGKRGIFLRDQDDNVYDLFGEAISGEKIGQHLKPTFSYMGYWFSISSMFPDPLIYVDGED